MKGIYIDSAIACKRVYSEHYDIGTVQFDIRDVYNWGGNIVNYQVLSIAGTNEFMDWPKNINLMSWKGIKLAAYTSAKSIKESVQFYRIRNEVVPLIVTGHSKGASTAIAFKKLFKADVCVAFAAARCLRYWSNRKMEDTHVFIDPDDPVSWVGRINFGHPKCTLFEADDDHFGFNIDDHDIDNWIQYCKDMEL